MSSGSWFSLKEGLVSRSGGNQQDINLIRGELGQDRVPFQGIGGVYGDSPHPLPGQLRPLGHA